MDIEEMVKQIDTKELRAEAKLHGIKTSCVRKIDIAKQLPSQALERLASKSK